LKAHKVVLSICSSYFQEMFQALSATHHPILILKDTSASLMENLLEFMYHGSVNVKQDDLEDLLKLAETLKIKGLTTCSKQLRHSKKASTGKHIKAQCTEELNYFCCFTASKRPRESNEEVQPKHKTRKTRIDLTTEDDPESLSNEGNFSLLQSPEVSLVEPRHDLCENSNEVADRSPCNLKIVESQSLSHFRSFDFTNDQMLMFGPQEHAPTDVQNEVPSSSITMLSSTSLLHGNCIFNRNNTVATQSGLKTYWLCKSYRISMCKARCITHQGQVISATGVHNHLPHKSSQPQEIPPGHTPNVFNPLEFSVNYPHPQEAASPPYIVVPFQINQDTANQPGNSNQLNRKTEH
jgi:hypothetical protein